MERRDFFPRAGAVIAAGSAQLPSWAGGASPNLAITRAAVPMESKHPIKIGLDVFSVRDQGWKDFEILEYAAKQRLKHVQFSVTRFYRSLAPDHLRQLRARADALGIQLETGMDSICPTSTRFAANLGSAEQQLLDQLETAKILGSPIVRCYMGTMEDRKTELPFAKHVESMLAVLARVRSRFVDARVKVSIENHAGDFPAKRLRAVIEETGKDWVGATYDSGNPCWTLEDPLNAAETLAPYIATVHLRDSYVFTDENGLLVQWVRFGEGNVRVDEVLKRLHTTRPDLVFNLETICTGNRPFPVKNASFWKGYEDISARDFLGLYALAEKAGARPAPPARSREDAVRAQLEDSDASITGLRKMVSSAGLTEA